MWTVISKVHRVAASSSPHSFEQAKTCDNTGKEFVIKMHCVQQTAFYWSVSVNHAANQGLRFSRWLLIGGEKKSAVLQYSMCLLALLGLFACQMVPVHLFCRCGVPPFDEEMTRKELRLSLIHSARHYEFYYLTKIIYWPITWSTLLGKLFQFGPHQEFFFPPLFSCLFYALTIFYSCFFTAERARVMPCQTLWCSTDQMRSTLCVIVWSWSSVANMALMVSQTLWSQHSFLKVLCVCVWAQLAWLSLLWQSVFT